MAWIESHQDLAHHPKVARLASLLNVEKAAAIGYLHMFWWWCLSYADDGDITEFSAAEVADGAQWRDEPADFLEALRSAGWVDGSDVHDWWDYAGKLVERRRSDAERKRKGRAEDVPAPSTGHPPDDRKDGVRTNPTQPNRTQPTISEAAKTPRSDPLFESIVEVCFGLAYESGETQLTSKERGMANRARAELNKVEANPYEVRRRANHFLAWVGQMPTPDNLVTHWNRLNSPQQKATPAQLQRLGNEIDRQDRMRQIQEAAL